MLAFLLVCFFFQTLRGAPLTPHASQSLSARDSPAAPEQQYRTTFDILKSCLLTIFACVWTSAHPNLNGPRDSGWTCFKRKVVTMLCALIAPELMFYWALKQRSAAKEIAEHYNSKFATSTPKADPDDKENKSLWKKLGKKLVDWFSCRTKIVDWFHPLPEETTHRGAGQAWTTTHGFFIQMGGFILYSNSKPVEVLTYEELTSLLDKKEIDAPTVTERELQDRSKGDWLSKGIIVLQTTWFIVQCAARASRRLPLSELEVLTLAFAVMNGTIYAAWWDKPQGADTAICVPLKTVDSAKSTVEDTVDSLSSTGEDIVHPLVAGGQEASVDQPFPVNEDGTPLLQPDSQSLSGISNSEHSIPPHKRKHEQITDEHLEHASFKWLRSEVQDDREKHLSCLVRLLRLPYLLVVQMLRVFTKIGDDDNSLDTSYLRMPMFYSDQEASDSSDIISLTATLFGAVHLLAWSSEFGSTRDLVLWQVSAVIVTAFPVSALLAALLEDVPDEKQSGLNWICGIIISLLLTLLHICQKATIILLVILVLLYIPARVALIFVAFNSLRNTPPGVLVDVPWTSYLPHF